MMSSPAYNFILQEFKCPKESVSFFGNGCFCQLCMSLIGYMLIYSWHSVNSIPFDATPPIHTYNANIVVICTFETGTLILDHG